MFDSLAVTETAPTPGTCRAPSCLPRSRHRYAELHAHSAYSFLDGANEPEELAAAACELGLEALALTDHDGMPGIVRHAEAGRSLGLATVHGSELTLAEGTHLPVLARDPTGYRRLVGAISQHNLDAGSRREPAHEITDLASAVGDSCLFLTGTGRGPLRRALGDPRRPQSWDLAAGRRRLGEMVDVLGQENLAVEVALDGGPGDAPLTQVLTSLARTYRLPLLATGAVRCARPSDSPLADVLTATRLGTDLDGARGFLPATGRWLRSAQEMARLHHRAPQAVDATVEVAQDLSFDLALLAPDLPAPQVPEGHTPDSWLARLTTTGALARYGTRQQDPHAWEVIDHELEVITSLGFSGYFLIVRSIVDFCEQQGILCQGRGSAANSAVCYALGITAVDAVRHRMLFERFLSPGRHGYPDIDLDIEACRREEVIQHVYSRYGRLHAAQVANVISYRPRSALRDASRALGHPPALQEHSVREDLPAQVRDVADRLLRLPRHLGVHSGGMVLAATPVAQVCPVRWAATPGRTVLQWDKDDCAAAGLVKFDLLGLGILTALRRAFTSLAERGETVPDPQSQAGRLRAAQVGQPWGLHTLPAEDPAVYRLLCAADTVGVFQVESRAQMATLPRLRPQTFYDIVVEVALIRPGPIQGGAVNPYLRRRLGQEPVTYLHPLLRPALEKTLGVPLFQEQLMQIAIDAAGFTPAQADSLRQAMGAKRSLARMEALHGRIVEGMQANGIDATTAEQVFDKLRAFADFGFPESHAFSFAYLVYASAWLKVRRPEDFYAGVLASQPMGFWAPRTLVDDALRHGVRVEQADVNLSDERARVQQVEPAARPQPHPQALTELDLHPHLAVRLGLAQVKGVGPQAARRIVEERRSHGPYTDISDLARRVRLPRRALEALSACGALESMGGSRRTDLWAAGALSHEHAHPARAGSSPSPWYQPSLPGTAVGMHAPSLGQMLPAEVVREDLALTGTSVHGHPMAFVRALLAEDGVLPVGVLSGVEDGRRVRVAGVVTHRQHPHTAAGTVFLNLEDETGLLNVICSPGMWRRYQTVGRRSGALLVRGRLERADGVTAVLAEHLEELSGLPRLGSRDWV